MGIAGVGRTPGPDPRPAMERGGSAGPVGEAVVVFEGEVIDSGGANDCSSSANGPVGPGFAASMAVGDVHWQCKPQ